ncbi:MAG TPA: hypothetical protein VGR22_01250 [Thermomicrobiales bacterium]|nr:hypothetical protein [Thermomicrobiales bacterium]
MKTLRKLFTRKNANGARRFDRYYGQVVHAGSGYPTADEARRDMRDHDRMLIGFGLPR